jgi:hypothetical protein
MDQLIVNKNLDGLTMCHCEGEGVADGIAIGAGGSSNGANCSVASMGWNGVPVLTVRLREHDPAPRATKKTTDNLPICEMRSPTLAFVDRPSGTGSLESEA